MTTQTATLADEQFASVLEAARQIGAYGGKSAGSWVLDGNSSEQDARHILKQIENCEFETPNTPLSGEWAGDLTIADLVTDALDQARPEIDVDDEFEFEPEEEDDICQAFEDAWSVAYSDEARTHGPRHAQYRIAETGFGPSVPDSPRGVDKAGETVGDDHDRYRDPRPDR